jgi:RHS repeat-associated protein
LPFSFCCIFRVSFGNVQIRWAETYTYDQSNRLTQKSYPDTTTVNYTYDLVGKIQQVNDPTGTYAFAYDNAGRLIGTTTSYSFLSGRNFTTSYSYDAASNRTGFTDPEGGSTAYVYDTLNRLSMLTPPSAFTTGSFGFGYDALSRRTQLTRPNGVATSYAYDNLSRLQSVLHQLSGSTIDGASYILDNAGNRTAKTDQRTAVATSYGYDNIYQLLSATQGATTTENYTYDPVGNRLSDLTTSGWSNNTSNELTSRPGLSYTFDNNGNELTKVDSTGTTSYTWDYENRLTSVTLPGSGGTVSFSYDPLGRRIKKVSSAGTSVFAYDGDNLIEETNSSGTVVARYSQTTDSLDEPLAVLRGGTTSYYNADGLGTITSLSNGAGSLAQTYTFDSFGKQTASSGSLTNPFQYAGRELDSETALYYMRARYFDPGSGRFINEDPIMFGGGRNFYAYTGNSPVVFADPSGLNRSRHKVCPIPPVGPHTKLPIPIKRCASGPLIGCLIEVESQGDPNARSAAGATGLLQVTPIMGAALQNYGLLTPGMSPDDEGHTYFNLLLSYCENVSYAIAAYNAGPTAVNRAGGIPNNRETRNEVKRVDKCLKQQLHISDGLQHPNLAPACGCQ